ncbi:type VI secretion system protein TssA [Pseudomonas sp. EA_65y_Pfl1_P113]|uniref:type VI secretion system protein TssA n=1 Tax=Pseudomonas sp. EA_65y_Pfl1_P113 TaxID=3088692 RepID=UPI0030DB7F94
MTTPDEELGAFPISDANPVGVSPRDGVVFARAQAEIDKLSSIHSQSGVDWTKVAAACSKILLEEGKDLTVAIWLLCAWTVVRGTDGLATGAHVLRGLLENYWDSFTPPLARLRARRNQAQWMLDWLEVRLSEGLEPVPGAQLAGLLDDWDAIDVFWRERDDDGPSFFRLRRLITELPVQAIVEVPAVVTEPVSQADNSGAGHAPVGAAKASDSALLLAPAHQVIGNLDSDESVEKAINDVFSSLTPLIEFCVQNRCTLPLLFRLNRQMAWITLDQAPPSTGNATRLPAPPESQVDTFLRVQVGGEPLDVVRFCEERLIAYPYWLDLNRASHVALSKLGASAAAAAASLTQEVRNLLARIPVLPELTFSDGQPFADGATRSWIEGLVSVSIGGGVSDGVQALIDEAGTSAAEGRLNEAMVSLQDALREAGNGRDRFRLRRAQCELLHRFDSRAQLYVALDVLLQEARSLGLDRWEPELVRPVLELALVYGDGGSRTLWTEQLASIDLPAFWRLSGSPASDD